MSESQPKVPTNRAEVEALLRRGLADAVGLPADQVDSKKAFTAFGLDSIKAFSMTGDLAEWLDRDLPATLFWDHPNVDALATFVCETLGLEE